MNNVENKEILPKKSTANSDSKVCHPFPGYAWPNGLFFCMSSCPRM